MTLAAVPLGMSVLGGAMSMAKGFSEAGAYRTQAAQYEEESRFVALQARTDEANRLDQLNRAVGTSRAMAAAGNVATYDTGGSQEAFENANRDVISRNITYNQAAALAKQQQLEGAAAADRSNATWSIMGGLMQGASSIFGGTMNYLQVANQGASAAQTMAYSGGLGAGTMSGGADY